MNKNSRLRHLDDEAILDLKQQKQVLKVIATITLLVFIPLGIKNILIGEIMLGVVLLAFEISLLLEITALIYNKQTLFGHYIPLALLVISAVLAIKVFGTLATYWLYPVVISIIFLLPKNEAFITNFIMIICAGFAALMHQEFAVTIRYIISLIVTTIIVHVVVAAIRNLQQDLRMLISTDAMTGALNRHELPTALERTLSDYPCSSIVIIDIDNFKSVNDQHGHDVGDKVIVNIVNIINAHTTDNELLFRLGGDEFLLVIQGQEDSSAETLMNRLSKKIRQGNYPHNQPMTISSGIAQSKAFEEIKEWMKRADLALYQSKHLGRDRVSVYTPVLEPQLDLCSKSKASHVSST